ncbi:DUF2383 domain-containing protein [Clostridium fallax]|uniref:DUF2383 domain-containing protein n=1 Tax=Clostridium fallax TaxID=1533 RepID=A0A1M4U616_9CLOT|nr:DUF2383 domain-containing protein [Clostridium fallax]SHE52086.1 protein of unknown function [Clostridium fallax]SQB06094.1 Domain of uncharacterised function (DUF2383) [Clostridium fallax]
MEPVILKKDIVINLNNYIQGMYMGLTSFEDFINKSKDSNLKELLIKIYDCYKNHTEVISNRIIELNGKVEKSQGFIGKISEFFQDIKNLTINNEIELVKEVKHSIDTGTKMTETFLEENSSLDDNTRIIIDEFIRKNKEFSKELSDFYNKIS